MNIPGVGDQYQIIVSHKELDRLAVRVEVPANRLSDAGLLKRIRDDLFAVLAIHSDVELVQLGSLPRSEVGKALRVVDLRPKEQS